MVRFGRLLVTAVGTRASISTQIKKKRGLEGKHATEHWFFGDEKSPFLFGEGGGLAPTRHS
jgi:hypothetical protein